jgi:hypothetical protein
MGELPTAGVEEVLFCKYLYFLVVLFFKRDPGGESWIVVRMILKSLKMAESPAYDRMVESTGEDPSRLL